MASTLYKPSFRTTEQVNRFLFEKLVMCIDFEVKNNLLCNINYQL